MATRHIVDRQRRGGFAALVLGSVPYHHTHHCARPVLVMPAAR